MSNRVGLARVRPLTIKPIKMKNTSGKDVAELPDGKYFNETREKEFWEQIEKVDESKIDEKQADELKRTEQVTDLQDTSGKIRSLVRKFDDIDQETLMNLAAIYDQGTAESLDEQSILNDSKRQVVDLISQLKIFSDSQSTLVENLKYWFSSLEKRSEESALDLGGIPNVNDVITSLGAIVQEFAEKSERAECLHNDITDCLFKQFAQLKRVIATKNEDIKKLQKIIDDNNSAAERRKAKKKEQGAKNEEGIKKEQFEAQIRQNQELKGQVEQLKKQLQDAEIHRASLMAMGGGIGGDASKTSEMQSTIATLKLENESMTKTFSSKVDELNAQIQKLKLQLQENDEKFKHYEEKLKKKDQRIEELDSMLQKTLQQQMQEIDLKHTTPSSPSKSNNEQIKNMQEEMSIMELKHSEEIKKIQNDFKNELKSQLDYQRSAFARERQQLVNSLGSQDQSALIKSIQAACDKRIEELTKENEKIREDSLKQLSAKIALLTRQYEHRIKSLNQSHQGELDSLSASVEMAKKQLQIDFDGKLEEEIQKISEQNTTTQMDGKVYIEKLEGQLKKRDEETKKLREALMTASKTGEVNPALLIPPEREPLERPESLILLDSNLKQSKIFTSKLKIAKEELEDQCNWQLEKQKEYYERKISENALKQQSELRQSLMGLQEAVNKVEKVDDLQGISNIIENIAKVFCDMNDQLSQIESQPKVPMVTVEDAGKRTKVLTDRIIDLRQQCQELSSHSDDLEQIETLKQQLALARNMSDGNQQKIFQQFDEINAHYKEEIEKRDKIINEFQSLDFTPKGIVEMNWFKDVIFTKSPDANQFPTLVDENTSQTPKQMISMSTTPLQTNRFIDEEEVPQMNLEMQSKTIVHMDQPIIIKNNDDTIIVEPDGTQKVTKPNGVLITIQPNGTQIIKEPNGTETTIDPSGVQYRKEPDGTHVTIDNNGSQFIVRPNGLQYTIQEDGVQQVVRPDGKHVTIDTDGTQEISQDDIKLKAKIKKGGNQFIEIDGSIITIDNAGMQFRKQKDGSEVTFDNNGSQFIEMQDGTRVTINQNGTQNIVDKDGTKVTISPDGSQTIKRANGESFIIDDNGDTYQIKENGENVKIDDDVVKPYKPYEKVEMLKPFEITEKQEKRKKLEPYVSKASFNVSPTKPKGKKVFTLVNPAQALSIFGNKFEYIEKFDPIDILGTRPRSARDVVKVTKTNASVQTDKVPEKEKIIERIIEKELPVKSSRSTLSISNETFTLSKSEEEVKLALNESFISEQMDQNISLKLPSAPQTYHVSPALTPRFMIQMSFCGEKPEIKIPLSYSNYEQIYLREPLPAVYPEISPEISYEKPVPDKKLVMALFDAFERQEMKIEVISSLAKPSKDNKPKLTKYSTNNNIIFDGKPYKILVDRKLSDVYDQTVILENVVEPNKVMLEQIKLAAIQRYETMIKSLKSDIEILHEQLQRKPELVVINDGGKNDDLRPPQFSHKPALKTYGRQALGLPPDPAQNQQSQPKNEFVVEENPQPVQNEKQNIMKIQIDDVEKSDNSKENILSAKSKKSVDAKSTGSSIMMDLNISGVDIQNDPFGSSGKILSTQLRALKEFIEDDSEVMEKVASDTDAYYAYISATGVTDESHYDFINSLKSSKEEHDNYHQQLFYIQSVGMMLSKCLNAMKSKYSELQNQLKSMKDQQNQQNSKMQEEILSSIVNTNKDMSDSVNQLDLLHKLENSLNVVNDIGLVRSESDEKEWELMLSQTQMFEEKLSKNQKIEQEQIDRLSVNVQSFIGKLNTQGDSPKEDKSVDAMMKDLQRIRKQRNELRKRYDEQKKLNDSLTIQIQQLRDQLQELKESESAEKTAAAAQLANLKEIVNITNSANPEDAKAIYSKQLLNMASIFEAANAEKAMLMSKLNDLEQSLATSHERENKLQAEIGDLIENNLDLKHSNSSSILFKDADIEHLREQLSADKEVNQKQRQQLEEATAQNALLIQSNAKLEEENFKLRKDIRQLNMQIDDLQLKQQIKTVKKKEVKKPPKLTADKATQKSWNPEPIIIKQKEEQYKPMKDKDIADGLLMKTIDQLNAKPIIEEKIEEKQEEEIIEEQEEKKEEEPKVNEENIKLSKEEEDTVEMPLISSSSDLFYKLDADNDSEDEFSAELSSITNQQQIFSIDENVPHLVHEPLMINKKKPKIVLPTVEKKDNKRQSHKRHITQMNANLNQMKQEELDITIGNAVQGKRQVTGVSNKIKPTTNLQEVTATIIAATQKPKSDQIPVITSSLKMPMVSYSEKPSQINAAPSNLSQTISNKENLPAYVKIDNTLESAPPAPLRITLVVKETEQQKKEAEEKAEKSKPIVSIPPPLQRTSEDPVSIEIRGAQIQQEKNNREVQAAMRLVGKLREQVKRLSDQNEECEKTIVELRQKISDLTLQLHRAKLEVIKANDERKRTQIRADNIKNRLEICYKEMSSKDDQIVRLKRDNMLLRSVAQPINEAATRISHAQRERERLQREKKQRDQVKAVTTAALASATNTETAKHLQTLLTNTENSMARLEAKRRMWMEIERKNTMSVLSAMSLLSTSEVQTVKNVLPEYSPFNSRRTNYPRTAQATLRTDEDVKILEDGLPSDLRKPMTYTQKISAMDKVQPPLTPEERRDIVLRKESPELLSRLAKVIAETPDPNLKNESIVPAKQ